LFAVRFGGIENPGQGRRKIQALVTHHKTADHTAGQTDVVANFNTTCFH